MAREIPHKMARENENELAREDEGLDDMER